MISQNFLKALWKKFWGMKKCKIEGWCIAEAKPLMHQPFKISQLLFQKVFKVDPEVTWIGAYFLFREIS